MILNLVFHLKTQHAAVTKQNICPDDFYLLITSGLQYLHMFCCVSNTGSNILCCVEFDITLPCSHCTRKLLYLLFNFSTSWCCYHNRHWHAHVSIHTEHLYLFLSLFPSVFCFILLVHQSPDPLFILLLYTYTLFSLLLSSLALLIPRHVWLGLFPPAPHNKTMMDLITAVTQAHWHPVSVFFSSLNFVLFLCACLSFCLPPFSLSLPLIFPPLLSSMIARRICSPSIHLPCW